MASKKIVIISPFQFTLFRGIESYSFNLARQFTQKGLKVIVYTWSGVLEISQKPKFLDNNILVRTVPNIRYYRRWFAAIFYNLWLVYDKPENIILNFLYHGEDRLFKHFKYFYVLHSPPSAIPERYVFIKKHLSSFKNMELIAVSDMVERQTKKIIPNCKTTTIYNGIDTAKFKPIEAYPRENRFLKLVSFSALEKRKGIHFIIQAIANSKYKNRIVYDIYGSGDEKTFLHNLIRKNNLDKIVTIKDPICNVEEVLPKYDLFCLPAKGESFCLAALEALSCGIPIFVSKYEPFKELFDEKVASFIDTNDLRSIIFELEKYFDQNFLDKKKKNTRKQALRFSLDIQADNYLDIMGYK